jgi:hypothetical protein
LGTGQRPAITPVQIAVRRLDLFGTLAKLAVIAGLRAGHSAIDRRLE